MVTVNCFCSYVLLSMLAHPVRARQNRNLLSIHFLGCIFLRRRHETLRKLCSTISNIQNFLTHFKFGGKADIAHPPTKKRKPPWF